MPAEEKLLDLIQNNAPIDKIKDCLQAIDEKKLEVILNNPVLEKRPLHLALIHHNDTKVTQLLLEFDSPVIPETVTCVARRPYMTDRDEVSALLDFYSFLQSQTFQDKMPYGKTLSLVREGMVHLEQFHEHPSEEAIMLLGATGVGKSTLFNVLYDQDIKYKLVEDEASAETRLELHDSQYKEMAKTSQSALSETSYPLISPINDKTTLIDMPGHNDTGRDIARKISVGLSLQGLTTCFKKLRTLAVVVLQSDIYSNPRAESFQKTLTIVAKAIKLKPELKGNLLFIMNRVENPKLTAKHVKAKILGILKDAEFPEDARLILSNLEEEQIILIHDEPSHTFRDAFFEQTNKMTPVSLEQFNFADYNQEAELFKRFIGKILVEYQSKAQQQKQAILLDAIKKINGLMASFPSTFFSNLETSENAKEILGSQENNIQRQKKWEENLLQICKEWVKQGQAAIVGTPLSLPPSNLSASACKARLDLIENMIASLMPILKHLKLERSLSAYAGTLFNNENQLENKGVNYSNIMSL